MAAQFGNRLRKGATTTAVAAVAVAALAASQAPGVTTDSAGRQTTGTPSPDALLESGETATGNSRYYTDLPPLDSPTAPPGSGGGTTPGTGGTTGGERGIPATVLDAYKQAEAKLREAKPGCHLPWQLLAAIGKVESGQARGGRVDAEGTTIGRILGPQLNGSGFANISDTDDGAYDGDTTHDRAVGPMQFIPSTWEWAGRDGNDDGRKDPNNVYDAALAAGHYLCRFGWDLSDPSDLRRAILSYNNSTHYYNTVLSWLEFYRRGSHEVPDGTGSLPRNPSDGGGRSGSGSGSSHGSGSGTSGGGTKTTPPKGSGSGKPGGGGGKGGTTPKPPATPQTPTDTVHHLKDAGTAKLTAQAGDTFAKKISTRAETRNGKAVGKVRIRFTITGSTDAVFAGGENVATVVTNDSGVAVAPVLKAGEKTGEFTVRATVVGRTVAAVEYRATVTARAADALVRTSDTALTCVPGGEFAELVELKATYKGAVADRVAATATLITSAEDATENDKGPYFEGEGEDEDGKPVRTLALKTDKDGLLKLPRLHADDTTGTFVLRVTTTGGAVLDITLTVEAPETPGTPDPEPST